jgi:hypothetical protein
MNDGVIYAEEVNYWKTSKASADTWLNKACREIEKAGGMVLGRATMVVRNEAMIVLQFVLSGDTYKISWPVLQSKTGNLQAAQRQAATMLYHDVKARCLSSRVLGARRAFASFLLLSQGSTIGEVADPSDGNFEIALSQLPPFLPSGR